jgi:hypothetical protein
MVSLIAVRPIDRTIYPSVLEALEVAGITLRFVDKETFESLIKNPTQKQMIDQIVPYL